MVDEGMLMKNLLIYVNLWKPNEKNNHRLFEDSEIFTTFDLDIMWFVLNRRIADLFLDGIEDVEFDKCFWFNI